MNPDTYIAPVFNKFLDIIQRHATYLISSSSYVGNLKNKREVLDARKADMNTKIEDAERMAQKATNEVDVWKKQVDDILRKIDEVVNAYETRSCLCAICSDYKTGHHCDDMIKEVDRLLDGGSVLLMADMIDDNSIALISMPNVVPGSLDSYYQDALKYIEDGNSKANVLGIWGMGGVGKTTLLKRIHNSFTGRSIFSHVIWIVASSEQSNISRIQSEIAKELKLNLNENDDVQSKARKIYNFLMNKNFLLFIDDLWEVVDLYEAGVPNPYEEGCGKHRKIVFTTRSKVVCGNMEAKKIIEVKCLDPEKSWLLFKEKVGEQVIQSHPRISQLAKDVANECKGLPLALITIGRAMSTRSDPDVWKYALELMKESQGHDILDTDKSLLSVLKISYDFLPNEQLRKCFLSISLWPEDDIIRKGELIECWMGLDIINNVGSMDEAYQIGLSLIDGLLAASLLEHVTDFFSGIFSHVKMHDVLRHLAVWIASDCGENKYKWMVKAKTQLQYAPSHEVEKAECISLMYNRLNKLPSGITRCSNLLTLVLRSNRLTSESISDCFHNFLLLKYLDLSHNDLDNFPEVICALTELQYLNLSYNKIKNIPEKLRDLKKLKYLILRWNRIHNLPTGVFSELAKLLVLDLYNPYSYTASPLVNVEELKWLEKKLLFLGIIVRGDEAFNKLLDMSDLSIVHLMVADLHITYFNFMSMIPNPYRLRELKIADCSLVEISFERNDIYQNLPSTNLEQLGLVNLYKLEKIIWKDIKPEKLFANLKDIDIRMCYLLDDITWIIYLPSLICLSMFGCTNMRIAIKNEENDKNTYEVEPNILTFPSLKTLEFNTMANLEKISNLSLAFPNLRTFEVKWCPLLKRLPFEIESTRKLEMIKGEKVWWDKVEWEDDDSKSHFSPLFREREW